MMVACKENGFGHVGQSDIGDTVDGVGDRVSLSAQVFSVDQRKSLGQ